MSVGSLTILRAYKTTARHHLGWGNNIRKIKTRQSDNRLDIRIQQDNIIKEKRDDCMKSVKKKAKYT